MDRSTFLKILPLISIVLVCTPNQLLPKEEVKKLKPRRAFSSAELAWSQDDFEKILNPALEKLTDAFYPGGYLAQSRTE